MRTGVNLTQVREVEKSADVAQLVEYLPSKQTAAGSSPVCYSNINWWYYVRTLMISGWMKRQLIYIF